MTDPLLVNGTDPAERWETRLAAVARALPYPPTPDLAPAVVASLTPRPPRLAATPTPLRFGGQAGKGAGQARGSHNAWRTAWALAAVLVVLAGLLAVPSVRAGLSTILEIGVVRIFLGPVPTSTLAPTATGTRRPTLTPRPTPSPLASVLDLDGLTTLADARERVNLPIVLPTYPAGLGEPDAVFVQDLEGEAVVLVWLEPDDPARVRLSLHVLASSMLVEKLIKDNPAQLEFTRVNGREAFWTTGPYYVVNRRGDYAQARLIEGHVLIWYDRTLTYRLETDLPLEEAVKIAESLE